jgi:hypothetical protein
MTNPAPITTPPPTSKKFTIIMDQTTSTKVEWIAMFLKEIGVPNPKIREIFSRSIDCYVDLLEELAVTYSCKPNAKEIRDEIYAVMSLNTERPSAWNSTELPKIDLSSYGAFPKYSILAKQYHNPIKPLPKIRKPRKQSLSFADLQAKRSTNPTQL